MKTLKQFIKKHKIIEDMNNSRIFYFDEWRGEIRIFEDCEGHFNKNLSKDDCINLANAFKELSEIIEG